LPATPLTRCRLFAENVTIDNATFRNGRTEPIRVGVAANKDQTGEYVSVVRRLSFLNIHAIDLRLVADLGYPPSKTISHGAEAEISGIRFENVTVSFTTPFPERHGRPTVVQMTYPISNLTILNVLLPGALPSLTILRDATSKSMLPSKQPIRVLSGLELTASAPRGGHHTVELDNARAVYAEPIRMGGQLKRCPCHCGLQPATGNFECKAHPPPLLLFESWPELGATFPDDVMVGKVIVALSPLLVIGLVGLAVWTL
jgi:hypothetical protein